MPALGVRGLCPQEPPDGKRRPGQHENSTREKKPQGRGRHQRGGMGSPGGRQGLLGGSGSGQSPQSLGRVTVMAAAEATGGAPGGTGWPRSHARALSVTLRTLAPPGSNWESPQGRRSGRTRSPQRLCTQWSPTQAPGLTPHLPAGQTTNPAALAAEKTGDPRSLQNVPGLPESKRGGGWDTHRPNKKVSF